MPLPSSLFWLSRLSISCWLNLSMYPRSLLSTPGDRGKPANMGILAHPIARRHTSPHFAALRHSSRVSGAEDAARAWTQMPHSNSIASWRGAQPAKPRKKRMPAASPPARATTSFKLPPIHTPGLTSRAPSTSFPYTWSHRKLSFKEFPLMMGPPRKSWLPEISSDLMLLIHWRSSVPCHLSSICPNMTPVGLLRTMPVTLLGVSSSAASKSKTA
mmetsp:Transcript_41618/g.115858  ORF Transcript_41618/g.115858 Transcript_41618/m.115858 type:complete len:215 (-) Transcript_41618:611-1255(-)